MDRHYGLQGLGSTCRPAEHAARPVRARRSRVRRIPDARFVALRAYDGERGRTPRTFRPGADAAARMCRRAAAARAPPTSRTRSTGTPSSDCSVDSWSPASSVPACKRDFGGASAARVGGASAASAVADLVAGRTPQRASGHKIHEVQHANHHTSTRAVRARAMRQVEHSGSTQAVRIEPERPTSRRCLGEPRVLDQLGELRAGQLAHVRCAQ